LQSPTDNFVRDMFDGDAERVDEELGNQLGYRIWRETPRRTPTAAAPWAARKPMRIGGLATTRRSECGRPLTG
ncbi:MAG: hypothetical protein ACRERC_07820, partial [Candidatus Binatia bacterium]